MQFSDDSDEDFQTIKQSKSSMKSIFESDSRSKKTGSQSLSYDGGKSKREAAQAAGPAGSSGNTIAKQSSAMCYKGEHHVGPCATVILITPSAPFVVLVDRERRTQARVRIDAEMQLLQNNNQLQFATLYDPAIQLHWSLMFKTEGDCTGFMVAALTVQHYMLLGEGPRQHFTDLNDSFDGEKAKKGDSASIAVKVWILQRVGSTGSFCIGKDVEEIALEAPRKITVGNGTIMSGIEEALPATPVGTRRLLFLQGKKTRVARALGNPEIGAADTAVVLLTVVNVQRNEDLPAFPGGEDDEDEDITTAHPKPGGKSKKGQRQHARSESPPLLTAPPPEEPAPTPAPAVAPAAPAATDTNQLLQTMLLQSLQMQNQPQQQRQPASPPESEAKVSVYVERSLDRLHQQLSGLYEKIDRLDFEKKMHANNEVLERMMKKAVGKMPVSEVDIEDMTKDRDQLLAKIESQKQRIEEMTDRYHKALEQLGQHKEVTAGLKNDLKIQQETTEKAIEELKSRKRLENVDAEVKYRRDLDRAAEDSFRKGREEGYQDGYNAGKVDAMTIAGSSTTDELRKMIDQKEVALVDWQRKVTAMESKHYEERRQHGDQVHTLNTLIRRLEQREEGRKKEMMDMAAQTGKAMKRIMNATYASIESQVYAFGEEKVNTEEVLQLILMTIKQEARDAIDEFKKDAAARASAPIDVPDDDGVPVVEMGATQQPPPPPSNTFTYAALEPTTAGTIDTSSSAVPAGGTTGSGGPPLPPPAMDSHPAMPPPVVDWADPAAHPPAGPPPPPISSLSPTSGGSGEGGASPIPQLSPNDPDNKWMYESIPAPPPADDTTATAAATAELPPIVHHDPSPTDDGHGTTGAGAGAAVHHDNEPNAMDLPPPPTMGFMSEDPVEGEEDHHHHTAAAVGGHEEEDW